jgi:hypothetical protein
LKGRYLNREWCQGRYGFGAGNGEEIDAEKRAEDAEKRGKSTGLKTRHYEEA